MSAASLLGASIVCLPHAVYGSDTWPKCQSDLQRRRFGMLRIYARHRSGMICFPVFLDLLATSNSKISVDEARIMAGSPEIARCHVRPSLTVSLFCIAAIILRASETRVMQGCRDVFV